MTKFHILFSLFLLSGSVNAAIGNTLGSMNGVIYGVAAGIAVLIIAFHALKYKSSDNPGDRENAKRGITNVIIAIVLLSTASTLVGILFVKPPEPDAPTTTTTTTTTTVPYLTAKNLVDCINKAEGMLFSLPDQCPHCMLQKANVFEGEKDNIVGPGATYYVKLTFGQIGMTCPCTGSAIPCWANGIGGKNEVGCKTFKQLNAYYGCTLTPYPNHRYKCCDGSTNC